MSLLLIQVFRCGEWRNVTTIPLETRVDAPPARKRKFNRMNGGLRIAEPLTDDMIDGVSL